MLACICGGWIEFGLIALAGAFGIKYGITGLAVVAVVGTIIGVKLRKHHHPKKDVVAKPTQGCCGGKGGNSCKCK